MQHRRNVRNVWRRVCCVIRFRGVCPVFLRIYLVMECVLFNALLGKCHTIIVVRL